MGVITQQSIKVFDQFTSEEPVEILDWTTNITFETIGRVGFGHEFKLLSDRNQPPNNFIEAMGYCLKQSIQRMQQAQFIKSLPIEANRKFDESIKLMHSVVDKVIVERKNSPDAKDMEKDLLGYMLNARDEHNLGLTDENIRDQVVTFVSKMLFIDSIGRKLTLFHQRSSLPVMIQLPSKLYCVLIF